MQPWRIRFVSRLIIGVLLVVVVRLFYWQVLSGSKLQALAQIQHQSTIEIPASRGQILASDGFPLVTNQPTFLTYAYLPDLKTSAESASQLLAPILAPTPQDIDATPTAELSQQLIKEEQLSIKDKLLNQHLSWVPLKRITTKQNKDLVEALGIKGIGFEEYQTRFYPEASMAAQLLGFVGSDGAGNPKGYFGLEGYYNFELTGKPGIIRQEADAAGRPIVVGDFQNVVGRDGRTLKTHIERSMQLMIEKALVKGVEKYQASGGEVIVMDPQTGGVLAMAATPSYDQRNYKKYGPETYRIPSISDQYEPGSTFKILVMAAAINEGVVTPDTICNEECAHAVTIGKYTIRTWNDEYNPGETMNQVLERSDNTGMIFAANKLGKDAFVRYIKAFGIGEPTNIDLEAETIPHLRDKWGEIDIATGSFGQGLAVTSMQMLRATAAIANGGKLMEPHVVDQVITQDRTISIAPKVDRQVITPQTAQALAQMMEVAALHGEAQRAAPKGYRIAGKTGTAQIPIAGHYDENKTVASFVGFAPTDNPKFAMIVKLREPQSSPWAAETAAPLWFSIAKDLFYILNIPPSTTQ